MNGLHSMLWTARSTVPEITLRRQQQNVLGEKEGSRGGEKSVTVKRLEESERRKSMLEKSGHSQDV